MLMTRAMILPFTLVLTAFVFAQDAVPEALRLRVDQGTVTKYGGKSDSDTTYAFSFATGPVGARVPEDVTARLKLAFERDFERLPVVGRAGNTITLYNSTETVLEAREDGTRVVQVEAYSQTSGLIGIGQTVDQKFTRTHAPDGGVSFGDLSVKVQRNRGINESEDINQAIIKGTEQGVRTNLVLNAVIFSGCYQSVSGAVIPLMFDPKLFAPTDSSSAKPEPLAPVRVGDLRLDRNADGGAECRVSLEPKRYGLNSGPVTIVTRWTLQFLPDGRLEHSEFVSSTILNYPEATVADFEFEGKTYRVRYVRAFRSSGSSDRLE
jgi:hypothetical protein